MTHAEVKQMYNLIEDYYEEGIPDKLFQLRNFISDLYEESVMQQIEEAQYERDQMLSE